MASPHVDASDQWHEKDLISFKRQNALKHSKNLMRSDRSQNPPKRFGKPYTYNSEQLAHLFENEIYKQAIESTDQSKWYEAIRSEKVL